jgi:KUP system potassium uptake protein
MRCRIYHCAIKLTGPQSNIAKHDPKTVKTVKMERYNTDELPKRNKDFRSIMERSRVAHALLKVIAVFGVSLILADSILTPAQSVLGAIQGENPSLLLLCLF